MSKVFFRRIVQGLRKKVSIQTVVSQNTEILQELQGARTETSPGVPICSRVQDIQHKSNECHNDIQCLLQEHSEHHEDVTSGIQSLTKECGNISTSLTKLHSTQQRVLSSLTQLRELTIPILKVRVTPLPEDKVVIDNQTDKVINVSVQKHNQLEKGGWFSIPPKTKETWRRDRQSCVVFATEEGLMRDLVVPARTHISFLGFGGVH
jgi:seryl-tRNA synthetase